MLHTFETRHSTHTEIHRHTHIHSLSAEQCQNSANQRALPSTENRGANVCTSDDRGELLLSSALVFNTNIVIHSLEMVPMMIICYV